MRAGWARMRFHDLGSDREILDELVHELKNLGQRQSVVGFHSSGNDYGDSWA